MRTHSQETAYVFTSSSAEARCAGGLSSADPSNLSAMMKDGLFLVGPIVAAEVQLPDFEAASAHVLRKNDELYRRLA